MDTQALEILEEAESWDWPITQRIQQTGNQGGKYKAVTPQLLFYLIKESQALGGKVLDQFWKAVGSCHPKLRENIEKLIHALPGQASAILFEGVNRQDVDLNPVFEMAAEYFTHLAVAFMNPGGAKSGTGTPHSVSDVVAMETDKLLAVAKEEGFGHRKQAALEHLAFKRDGATCQVTGATFNEPPTDEYIDPILAHIIPNSVHGKLDTLNCLAMFAGESARNLVLQDINSLGNVINLQSDAHRSYDHLRWGIEAIDRGGGKVTYIYRRVPHSPKAGPGFNILRDGDEIMFGGGQEAEKLGGGPQPLLCNVQLAVAHVLHMSGAAEVILQIRQDADDSDFNHVYLASDYFCDILNSKLLLQTIHV